MLPPTHPDLINRLELKTGQLPEIHSVSDNPNTIGKVYARRARQFLTRLNQGLTQTHALRRHLANLNDVNSTEMEWLNSRVSRLSGLIGNTALDIN